MPVTPTYPGIYIEELPSTSHTIVPAPTSVTVFLGYTHPFKTLVPAGTPTAVFSFTEYERFFGGFFRSNFVPNDVPTAVQQFFLNGGGVAYIVPLPQAYHNNAGTVIGSVDAATYANGTAATFTALEPTDMPSTQMTISVKATDAPANTLADIVIAYGTHVETYRQVQLTPGPRNVENVMKASTLVTVAQGAGNTWTTAQGTFTYSAAPAGIVFSAPDFIAQLQADTPLDKLAIFNLLVIPGVFDAGVRGTAVAFCEEKRAFYIMDCATGDAVNAAPPPPPSTLVTADFAGLSTSRNAAFYFPWVKIPSPADGKPIEVAPSGTVAGVFAKTDNNRGVWKAPAGYETVVNNVLGLVDRGVMTDMQQGQLNPVGINCLRTFPGIGTVVFGARTTVAGNVALEQHKYVPVRRMTLFIEQTLYANLKWAIFEPNDTPLWNALRTSVEGFMLSLFSQGAFAGETPSKAFHVVCDATTTQQTDIDTGIVNILVAFRPLKPAEFVIIKIAQLAGQA